MVSAFAAELRALGPANFLYSDGDILFAHGHRRKQGNSSNVEPPGLVLLQRWCRKDVRGFVTSGLAVDGAETLLASVPLSDDPWLPLAEGEIVAVSKGQLLLRQPAGQNARR